MILSVCDGNVLVVVTMVEHSQALTSVQPQGTERGRSDDRVAIAASSRLDERHVEGVSKLQAHAISSRSGCRIVCGTHNALEADNVRASWNGEVTNDATLALDKEYGSAEIRDG